MAPHSYHDYENEPIGNGNPYYRCIHCKRSGPAINGRLEGHSPDCGYRLAIERGEPYQPLRTTMIPNLLPETYRNKKTGGLYLKLDEALNTTRARIGETYVLYAPVMQGSQALYARERQEFTLKFDRVQAAVLSGELAAAHLLLSTLKDAYRHNQDGQLAAVLAQAVDATNTRPGEACVIYRVMGVKDDALYLCESKEFYADRTPASQALRAIGDSGATASAGQPALAAPVPRTLPQLSAQEAYCAQLEVENAELRRQLGQRVIDSTFLTEFTLKNGAVDMQFEGGAAQLLAEMLAAQLESSGAANYLELSFRAAESRAEYLVTLQKKSGKTPHQLRVMAEQEAARLRDELASMPLLSLLPLAADCWPPQTLVQGEPNPNEILGQSPVPNLDQKHL